MSTVTLRDSVYNQVVEAAKEDVCTADWYVNKVLAKHFEEEQAKKMPSITQIILTNINQIEAGKEFTALDLMDSLHKQNPKHRRSYGQVLRMLIARRQVRAKDTGKKHYTTKIWVKE